MQIVWSFSSTVFHSFFGPKSGAILSQKNPTFSNFKVCEKFKDLSEDLTLTVVWSKKESVLQRKVVTFQKVCSETDSFLCFETIFVLIFSSSGRCLIFQKKEISWVFSFWLCTSVLFQSLMPCSKHSFFVLLEFVPFFFRTPRFKSS